MYQKERILDVKHRIGEVQAILGLLEEKAADDDGDVLAGAGRLLEEVWNSVDGLFPKESEHEPPKIASPQSEVVGEYYADNLIDAIQLGYSAVKDLLKNSHDDMEISEAITLCQTALVLYTNARTRTEKIIALLEQKVGKVQVLLDTGKGTAYESPIMGVQVLEEKRDPNF